MTISSLDASNVQQNIHKAVKIKVLVLRGGGGHYATFCSIQAVLAQAYPNWHLEPIFIDSLGEHSNPNTARKFFQTIGSGSDQFYDFILKHGLSWIHLITVHIHKVLTWLNHRVEVELLSELWQQDPPDLVLSVVPFHNRALWVSLQQTQPHTPVVSLLTDFADSPPSYWVEPRTDNYLICGTKEAVKQAIAARVVPTRIIQTSGLVIHPEFYQPSTIDVATERERLGLDPNRMTGLVLFGANGSNVMLEISKRLALFQDRLQLIFLCGRNRSVAEALNANMSGQKRVVVSFTRDTPYYMHLSDFFIGKPGNVSISEALVMNLPVITERNFLTLPQERYAADWIQEKEVGFVIPSFRNIEQPVECLLEPDTFAHYRKNITAIKNHAVFEIPEILNQILVAHSSLDETELTRNIEPMGKEV